MRSSLVAARGLFSGHLTAIPSNLGPQSISILSTHCPPSRCAPSARKSWPPQARWLQTTAPRHKEQPDYDGIPNFFYRHPVDFANPVCQSCLVPLIPEPERIRPWEGPTLPPPDGFERKPQKRRLFTPLCEPCAEDAAARRAAARRLMDRRMAFRRERLEALVKRVNAMPEGEHVPIRYAAGKLVEAVSNSGDPYPNGTRPERWYRDDLKHGLLSRALRIEKVGARWMCDKLRVDAMDFTLYFYVNNKYLDL